MVEVLLVTTRDTGRWIIPKGWPMARKSEFEAAALEAMEEAGALGRITPEPLGVYAYFKRRATHFDLVEVTVYRLDVTEQLDDWPEKGERRVDWFTPAYAAELVQEPGLASLLLTLAPTAEGVQVG